MGVIDVMSGYVRSKLQVAIGLKCSCLRIKAVDPTTQ
jgi:hypothetical protein